MQRESISEVAGSGPRSKGVSEVGNVFSGFGLPHPASDMVMNMSQIARMLKLYPCLLMAAILHLAIVRGSQKGFD